MKNRFRLTILLLTLCVLMAQKSLMAYAETEGSAEGAETVTQFDELSMDSTLSSLKIAQAALSPAFSPNQLTYTATVPYEVERVALTAQTNSPDASKVIRGTSDLKVGENTIVVTVTAEDGSVREYRITLTRQEPAETAKPVPGEEPTGEDPTDEESTQETEESAPEGNDPEDTTSEEAIPEETTQEEITSDEETSEAPETTTPGHGMVVEPSTDDGWDLNSMLLNPMFIIGLLAAIFLVLVLIIVAIIMVLREKRHHDDEDEDEENDEEEEAKSAEIFYDEDDYEEEDFLDFDLEIPEIETVNSVVYSAEVETKNLTEAVLEGDPEDDLDDDFEMLLEDDDDFDFLDF